MAKQYNRQVSTHDKPDHDKSAYNGTGGGRLGKDAYSHVLETRSQLCNTVNLLSTHIDPAKISPKNVLALQRYLGNRAVIGCLVIGCLVMVWLVMVWLVAG